MVVSVEGAIILKPQHTYLLGSEGDAYWKSRVSSYLKYTTNQGGGTTYFGNMVGEHLYLCKISSHEKYAIFCFNSIFGGLPT